MQRGEKMKDKQSLTLEQEVFGVDNESVFKSEKNSNLFYRLIDRFNQISAVLAGISLVLMMTLIVFNAVRRLYSAPIAGTVEIVSWLAAVTFIFSLGYAQLHKRHVYIDLFIKKLPPLTQRCIHTIVNVLSIAFFMIAVWQMTLHGIDLMNKGIVSETMRISFYPIVTFCSIGFLGLLMALIKETILIWRRGE